MHLIYKDEWSLTEYLEDANGQIYFNLYGDNEPSPWFFERNVVYDTATHSQCKKLLSMKEDYYNAVMEAIEYELPDCGFDYEKAINRILGD